MGDLPADEHMTQVANDDIRIRDQDKQPVDQDNAKQPHAVDPAAAEVSICCPSPVTLPVRYILV